MTGRCHAGAVLLNLAWASTPREHVVTGTLATIADAADDATLQTPAILILGDVIDLRLDRLDAVAPSKTATES